MCWMMLWKVISSMEVFFLAFFTASNSCLHCWQRDTCNCQCGYLRMPQVHSRLEMIP